jgi:hypothetical protein
MAFYPNFARAAAQAVSSPSAFFLHFQKSGVLFSSIQCHAPFFKRGLQDFTYKALFMRNLPECAFVFSRFHFCIFFPFRVCRIEIYRKFTQKPRKIPFWAFDPFDTFSRFGV